MTDPTWPADTPGLLTLPSGRTVRGRGMRDPMPTGPPPEFGLYPYGTPPTVDWPSTWVRWPDFWLPSDRAAFGLAVREVLELCGARRVEVACGGGMGRTGTTLACLAVLDGVPNDEAVAFVRQHYHPHAVETPWQRRFVRRFR